jgi:hypothetical protein
MNKFNIGDEIFFMENNEIKNAKIVGISSYVGSIYSLNMKKDIPQGEVLNIYHCGPYVEVEEDKAYKSLAELKKVLFAKFKE